MTMRRVQVTLREDLFQSASASVFEVDLDVDSIEEATRVVTELYGGDHTEIVHVMFLP